MVYFLSSLFREKMYKQPPGRYPKKAEARRGENAKTGGRAMLKGVNKRVVEVVDIESEYFERAILFLRPGRPDSDEGTLRRRAGEYVRAIKYRPRREFGWKKLLVAGALAGGLVLIALGLGGLLPL